MVRYKTPRIIGGIFKLLFTLLVLGVCGLLFWRVFFSTKIPSEIKSLTPNPALSQAYCRHDGKLTLHYQDLATITRADGKNYGYFSVYEAVFIPEAKQLQLIFRYNNSTIVHLKEDYGLEQMPDKSSHLFDVSIVKATDMTPEDKTDNLDKTKLAFQRIFPNENPVRTETGLYTYYRYVFDNVTLEEATDAVYVDIYYTGDTDYGKPAYGTLCIYAWDEDWVAYKPSKADIRAMEQ